MPTFFVSGTPVPQPRVKAYRAGNLIKMYTPKTGEDWRKECKRAAKEAMSGGKEQFEGPLKVIIGFLLPRPMSHYRASGAIKKDARDPTYKRTGDLDNYAKSVLDAMNGIVFEDDSQVVELNLTKAWGPKGDCGALVTVIPIG